MRRTCVAAALALMLAALAAPAVADPPSLGLGQLPRYEDDDQAVYAWQGAWTSTVVHFPSHRTGAQLYAVLFAPKSKAAAKRPGVVIVPGSGPGVQSYYHWAARDLAGHGYVALTVDPQGVGRSESFGTPACAGGSADDPCPGVPFQQADNYVDAFASGLDYLAKRSFVDQRHVGLAGHSLGARAASYLQGLDRRVHAVVAWDNLASDLQGDAGSASGGGAAGALIGGELPAQPKPVVPRVPALGLASDNRGGTTPQNDDPDQKKTAFAVWRKARMPSMELVMFGAGHNDFAQTRTMEREAQLRVFAYFTRAWFDRFLRDDRTATPRLLARKILGQTRARLFSSKFRSAAYFDGVDCRDFVKC